MIKVSRGGETAMPSKELAENRTTSSTRLGGLRRYLPNLLALAGVLGGVGFLASRDVSSHVMESFPDSVPTRASYLVTTWWYPVEGVRVILYGRTPGQEWELVDNSVTALEEGSARAGVSGGNYNDFAVEVSDTGLFRAMGGWPLGTGPHQDCSLVNRNRIECNDVSDSGIDSEAFAWGFEPVFPIKHRFPIVVSGFTQQ